MFFLDTSYFEALMNTKDINHENSLRIKDYIDVSNEQTVINTTVLVETLNRSVKTNILAEKMFDTLKANHQIINLTSKDYLNSLNINKYFGNSINYSDCTIVQTMIEMSITNIVTFDSDFKKIDGFNVISSIGDHYGISL